jgi:hypothetical protein
MKSILFIAAALIAASAAQAQSPAKAPAGATAQCKDGSFSSSQQRSEACSGHQGVKTWLGRAGEAVQTQSPAVSATRVAPSTTGPTPTPGTPENPIGPASPAPRAAAPTK